MSKSTIPEKTVATCDACGMNSNNTPSLFKTDFSITIVRKRDDDDGRPTLDSNYTMDLCDSCAAGVVKILTAFAENKDAYIDIVFEGPPGPEGGMFVEVENDEGASIRLGDWVDRKDGFWVLRIPRFL